MNDMTPLEGLDEERKEGGIIEISPDLESFLKTEYDRCSDTALEDERATAIKRYNGEPYGDEEEGRSQVVARDTAEVVDYMVVSILRTLVAGDRVVEFAHKDAELAQEITETIMHLFMDQQDGYQTLHDWLKAGLLEKSAVAMTFLEQQSPRRRTVEGVTALQLAMMFDDGAEIIEGEQTGEDAEGPVFTIVVKEDRGPKFMDIAVPNEEFYCSTDAPTIDAALLKGRRIRKHISELVAEGFSQDDLEMAGESASADDLLRTSRDDGRYYSDSARDGVARQIWWHEEFARFDANGDGIAELLYIRRTGDFKVFAIQEMEEYTDHPFEDWCPFPMQHRRIGQSLADKVMDLERIATVLMRQSLDGIYLANMPSTYVNESSIGTNTIEDLLNPKPGRIIRWKGTIAPQERTGQFNASDGFNMLEYLAGQREQRTGITRLNQGLDAETLNKTATGVSLVQAQGQQMEEYLARNFASALARLFTKKARLIKAYGKPIEVPIDGQYKMVDPSRWPDDIIARPRIGLGASRKEQKLAYRRELMAMQQAIVQGGYTSLVTEKEIFNAVKGFVADTGMGDINEYLLDPIDPQTGQPRPQQPKQDPAMAKVQADVQARQAEMQAKAQMSAAELQLKREEAAIKLQSIREEAEAELALEREKAAAQIELARRKAAAEAQLARERMAAEAQLEVMRMAAQRDADSEQIAADTELQKNREGGDLDK